MLHYTYHSGIWIVDAVKKDRLPVRHETTSLVLFHHTGYFVIVDAVTRICYQYFNNSLIPNRCKALLIRDNPRLVLLYLEITYRLSVDNS